MRCTHCNEELNFEEMYYYENTCEECEAYFDLRQYKLSRCRLIRLNVQMFLRQVMNLFK
ncbi:hypothetical protein ID858_10345 [Xenorhabdus sp. DI]|uniref:hypothetical protein n=1 Tax=Xenorhabdus doucetiae TaxID=351671 RepID=UPI0019A08513|nr:MULTISPECIES: hypothetical protein [unclassified Xenorhabdus]MBD2786335.1 hypothetical protein [Xenorhabdus sp. 3]MBD2788910.1 hypothetical protein [Xenorhabdus sp. DI]